jgi:hypothetical protein
MRPVIVEWPEAILAWSRGKDPSLATELLTAGADGWPHLTHLSCGEVLIDADGLLRLALWASSRGSANLAAFGRARFMLAMPDGVFEIPLKVIGRIEALPAVGGTRLNGFCLAPVAVREKNAPYATITSALRFALHDPQAVEARWTKVRKALLDSTIVPTHPHFFGRDLSLDLAQ